MRMYVTNVSSLFKLFVCKLEFPRISELFGVNRDHFGRAGSRLRADMFPCRPRAFRARRRPRSPSTPCGLFRSSRISLWAAPYRAAL